jgi:hypothetical protein
MAKAQPSSPPPPGDDRNLVTLDDALAGPSFEERVQAFWDKHHQTIIWACVAVLLVVVLRTGWDLWRDRQARVLGEAFAAAAVSEAELAAFASQHRGKTLSGVAFLQLADQAYARSDYASAREHYETAKRDLAGTIFQGRLALGLAITRLKSGEADAGEAQLRSLADDITQDRAVRSEAAFHLASLAADAGDTARLDAMVDQLGRIDPASTWAQRALMLQMIARGQATVPAALPGVGPAAGSTDDLPAISFDPLP